MSRLLNDREASRFKELLGNYELHEEAIEQFRASNFGVIAGPAGAGKDTLRDNLISRYSDLYLPILSTTTRPPRAGETDGKTYHFREIEEVEQGLQKREFFQAELVHGQQVSCLHISEIQKLGASITGLSILITATERKLRDIKPDIKTIFLIPPDRASLVDRMQSERLLDQPEIDRRLTAARKEIGYALDTEQYYCLISDTVEHVVARAHDFFQAGQLSSSDDREARLIMREIVREL